MLIKNQAITPLETKPENLIARVDINNGYQPGYVINSK